MDRFDLAVIGAGSAGLSLTAVAAQLGVRVALIERDRMGGDCLNAGCVPSKALLAASHAARSARQAARFGVHLPEPVIDWPSVRAHVQDAIAAIAPYDSEQRFRELGATVLRGTARFTAADRLEVDGREIAAKRIVVAAGSRPAVPFLSGLDRIAYLTNETLFDLEQRPRHLLILGGGPVGLEMAQAHAGLGCAVTLVTAGRLAPRDDPELAGGLRAALQADGVTIIEDATVTGAEPGPCLVLADGRRIAGSHLLVATGRRPSLAALNLEAAGVQTTRDGIATDTGLRSLTARHVFAAGDIADPAGIGPRRFTHVGGYHAGILVHRLLFRLPARINYAALPHVTYTDPELAQVGLTEAEAVQAGQAPRALRWTMAENDRAIAEGRTGGMVKLVVGKSGRLLGAGVLAPGAGEMIGLWALAISRKIPLSAVANMVLPYPTRAEAGKRAAGLLFGPRLFASPVRLVVRALSVLP